MNQLNLLDSEEKVFRPQIIMAAQGHDNGIIKSIISLHNGGLAFDADASYSRGVMWDGLPKPRQKFDIQPVLPDVVEASACDLPLGNESIGSIAFDPPFLFDAGKNAKIAKRFSAFENYEQLMEVYSGSINEFYRVLKPLGVCAFKCQSIVKRGKQHWTAQEVFYMAIDAGFECKDQFVKLHKHPAIQPGNFTQRHARRNFCTWWVFEKPKGGKGGKC